MSAGADVAVIRMRVDGSVAMNDLALAVLFGVGTGQIAARKLYGGSPFETATKAMRKRVAQRRRAFTRATGKPPEIIDVVRWWAERDRVPLMFRRDADDETVMITADGEVLDHRGAAALAVIEAAEFGDSE